MPEGAPFALLPIERGDVTSGFDCGAAELNRYLAAFAFQNHQAHSTFTCVAAAPDGSIAGYYSITCTAIPHDEAAERLRKGLARHPIGMLLLARLAVDLRFRGRGVGAQLLRHAFLLTVQTAGQVGCRGLLVDAKDDSAAAFYRHHGLTPLPGNSHRLFVLTKDIARLIAA